MFLNSGDIYIFWDMEVDSIRYSLWLAKIWTLSYIYTSTIAVPTSLGAEGPSKLPTTRYKAPYLGITSLIEPPFIAFTATTEMQVD